MTFCGNINSAAVTAFGKTINNNDDDNYAMGGSLAFTSSELTIDTGSVTATRSHHTLDTEADAATDDLDTIAVGSVSDGALLTIRGANSARTVTVKHGTGNINLAHGDTALDGALTLQRRGTDWHEIASSEGGWQVGDMKPSMRVAEHGRWLLVNGETFGSAASSATNQSDNYRTLFEYLWDNFADTEVAVVTGRGGSANADWAANKAMTLFAGRGRMLVGAGTGAGLTARTQGATGGQEDQIVVAHTHNISVESASAGSGGFVAESDGNGTTNTASAKALSVGSSGTNKNMPPWLAVNWFIKY